MIMNRGVKRVSRVKEVGGVVWVFCCFFITHAHKSIHAFYTLYGFSFWWRGRIGKKELDILKGRPFWSWFDESVSTASWCYQNNCYLRSLEKMWRLVYFALFYHHYNFNPLTPTVYMLVKKQMLLCVLFRSSDDSGLVVVVWCTFSSSSMQMQTPLKVFLLLFEIFIVCCLRRKVEEILWGWIRYFIINCALNNCVYTVLS